MAIAPLVSHVPAARASPGLAGPSPTDARISVATRPPPGPVLAAGGEGELLTAVPSGCALSADVTNPAGVLVTGQGFRSHEPFRIYLRPKLVAVRLTDSRGAFSVRIPMPVSPTGPQRLEVQGAGCALDLTFTPQRSVTNPAPGASATGASTGGASTNAASTSAASRPALPSGSTRDNPPPPASPSVTPTGPPRLTAPALSRPISLGLIGVIVATAAAVYALTRQAGRRRG